jgi:predicted NAD/FAD-binding protein
MPKLRSCYASWNVIASSGKGFHDAAVCVSYGVKSLQTLPPKAPDLFVKLNPPKPPRTDSILNEMTLSHPIFSMASWKAQQARCTSDPHAYCA